MRRASQSSKSFRLAQSTLGWASSTAFAGLLLGLVAVSLGKETNYDVWRNLTVGKWILDHGKVPQADPFTFTKEGSPWIDYEWMAEVLFWLVHRMCGFAGLVSLRILFVWGAAWLLMATFTRRTKGPPCVAVITILPGLVLSEFHLLVRPHLWSLGLAPLWVWWATRGGRWFLPGTAGIFCVWANTHSGTMGLLVLSLALVGGLVRERRLATVAVALLGLLANPYGWRIAVPLIRVLGAQKPEGVQVVEWMGLPLGKMPGFWAYMVISLGLLAVPGRRFRRWDAVVVVVFLVLTLRAVRMVPFATLLAAPGNAEALWLLAGARGRGLVRACAPPVAALMAALVVAPRVPPSFGPDPRSTPEAAASYVAERGLWGRYYNDMQYGAYLMWRWYPNAQVYMDNRTELFVDLAATERAAVQEVSAFATFLRSYGIRGAVLDYPWRLDTGETATLYPLFKFLGWEVVAWDDAGVLMLAPGADHDSLLAADGLKELDPFLTTPVLLPGPRGEIQLAEARRALQRADRSSRVWYMWGNIAYAANRPATALEAYRRVLELNRRDPDIHARLALALEKLGDYEGATREWKRQEARGLDLALVWYNLGRVHLQWGDPKAATRWLSKAVKAKPQEQGWRALLEVARNASPQQLTQQRSLVHTRAAALERQAILLMGQGRWQEAESLLVESLALVPWQATCHQNLGAALANQGLWEQAEASLQEALRLDPSLGWARYNLAGLLAVARGDTLAAIRQLDTLLSAPVDSQLRAVAGDFRLLLATDQPAP